MSAAGSNLQPEVIRAIPRGRNATLIAWACIVSGAVFTAAIRITFDRVLPQHKLRPGVAILQERFASKP